MILTLVRLIELLVQNIASLDQSVKFLTGQVHTQSEQLQQIQLQLKSLGEKMAAIDDAVQDVVTTVDTGFENLKSSVELLINEAVLQIQQTTGVDTTPAITALQSFKTSFSASMDSLGSSIKDAVTQLQADNPTAPSA